MKLIFVGLINFFALIGCATAIKQSNMPTLLASKLTIKSGHQVQNLIKSEENKYEGLLDNDLNLIVYEDIFSRLNQARDHFLNRRLILQKSFQSYIEPYFGVVEKSKCVGTAQLSGTIVTNTKNDEAFFLNFPVDLHFNPWDCAQPTPDLIAHYEFYFCKAKNLIYEIRIYSKNLDNNFTDLFFACK